MTGLKVDAAGVMSSHQQPNIEAKSVIPQSQEESKAKPAEVKPPVQPIQEYGNQPPSLNSVSSSAPTTYNGKLEQAYPASRNEADPANRNVREAFFNMRDFGYDNFEKNQVVITKFK